MHNDSANLKRERIAAGVSQAQIAAALGVSRQTVNSWEARRELPERKAEAYRAALAKLSVR